MAPLSFPNYGASRISRAVQLEALRRIEEKWGPIEASEWAAFIGQRSHVPAGVADALGRSVERYFGGDPEGSAFTAVPRIERLAREILLELGVGVFRPPRGSEPGVYPGLGSLLATLVEQGLDPSWARFLSTFLSRQEGLNLRNELSHGSMDDVAEGQAGLILIAALYLAVGVSVDTLTG
jgi:hypothetical protein